MHLISTSGKYIYIFVLFHVGVVRNTFQIRVVEIGLALSPNKQQVARYLKRLLVARFDNNQRRRNRKQPFSADVLNQNRAKSKHLNVKSNVLFSHAVVGHYFSTLPGFSVSVSPNAIPSHHGK